MPKLRICRSNKPQEKATCELCGEVFKDASPLLLFSHLLINHPFELAQSAPGRAFQNTILSEAEKAGAQFAEFLKGAFK